MVTAQILTGTLNGNADFRLIDSIVNNLADSRALPETIAAAHGLDADTLIGVLETVDVVQCPECSKWRNPDWENLDRCPVCRNW